MKNKIVWVIIVTVVAIPLIAAISSEFSADKGRRIEIFLNRIARDTRPTVFLRKATFTEDELNAYFNIFYARKYAPEVKYIKLKLEKENLISGLFKVELNEKDYPKVPSLFRDFEIEMDGRLESEKLRMRFVFKTIKINGTLFSPEILDETFGLAQGKTDVKKSIFDWFNMLPGIKRVVVEEKKITFYY
jgi:hypothetical protein